ncbi:hypothetical protein BW12_09715 [Bifidobacterium sp. UTCIF-3]|nr:hypothetical protein BW12_09715 [Bifidobacterium sp. UTCIF-3]
MLTSAIRSNTVTPETDIAASQFQIHRLFQTLTFITDARARHCSSEAGIYGIHLGHCRGPFAERHREFTQSEQQVSIFEISDEVSEHLPTRGHAG